MFVNEGQLSESFGPGTFELSTRTQAISSFFDSIAYKLNYPYKGDVYFVSTTRQTAQKWGTPAPFLFEDPKYGGIEVRAFGTFEYRITDPGRFLSEVVGSKGLFTNSEINGQLKAQLIDAFRSNLKRLAAEKGINVNHLDTHFYELKGAFLEGMNPGFIEKYGLTLTDFSIGGLNLPDDLRAILNKRREMDLLGDPERFARFQAANAMRDAAQNPGMTGGMIGRRHGHGHGPDDGCPAGRAPRPTRPSRPLPLGQYRCTTRALAARPSLAPKRSPSVWHKTAVPATKSGRPAGPTGRTGTRFHRSPPCCHHPPPTPSASSYHYAGPSGHPSQHSAAEIQALMASAPSARHMVWREGMTAWADAKTVPELQSATTTTAAAPSSRALTAWM